MPDILFLTPALELGKSCRENRRGADEGITPPPASQLPLPESTIPLFVQYQYNYSKMAPNPLVHVPSPDTSAPSGGQTPGMLRTNAISGHNSSINASIMTSQPGTKSAIHHHGDQDTIIYALKGRGAVVTDGGSTTTRLNPGDFVLIPKGLEHLEMNDGEEEVVWIITRSGSEADVVNVDGWSG